MSFTIGRKVVVIKEFNESGHEFKIGNKGTIVRVTDSAVGIDWDFSDDEFHSCGDNARKNHGWNIFGINQENLKVLTKKGNLYGF